MSKTVRGFIAVTLLINLWPVSQRLFADPVPAQPVLIYCDSSPGAAAFAAIWQSTLSAESIEWHTALSAESFETQLNGGNWSQVVVLAKYSPVTPAYAGALTAHAQAHSGKTISLWFWHDNGEQYSPDKALLGTTAMSTWRHGRTTTAYASVGLGSGDQTSATTTGGFHFPAFQGIQTVALTTWKSFTLASPSDGSPKFIIVYDPCNLIGLAEYILAVRTCKNHRNEHEDICDEMYGPSNEGPGDPPAYLECMQDASKNFSDCIKQAYSLWSIRVKRCQRHLEEATSQPADDPGGG